MNQDWSPPDDDVEKLGGRLDRIRCDGVDGDPRAPRIGAEWLPFAIGARWPLPEAGLMPRPDGEDGLPWQVRPIRRVGPWRLQAVIGRYTWRHAGRVTSLDFSPDGRLAISGSVDSTARIWDTRTGREISTLQSHTGIVSAVSISPDGCLAVTGSNDETVAIHDLATGRVRRVLDVPNTAVHLLAWLPDRVTLAVALDDGSLQLHDIRTGRRTGELHSASYNPVVALRAAPGARLALTATADASISLWNLVSGTELKSLAGEQTPPGAVAFAVDGRHALIGLTDGRIRLREVATGREVHCMADGSAAISALAASPCGTWMASGSDSGELHIRRLDGRGEVWRCTVGPPVSCLAFSPDSAHVLAGCRDGTLVLVPVADEPPGWPRGAMHGAPLAMDAVGRVAAVIARADPARPRLWQIERDGPETTVQEFAAPIGDPRCVAVSPDGRQLLIGGERAARLWCVSTGTPGPLLNGDREPVSAVAFSADGKRALVADRAGEIAAWQIHGAPRTVFREPVHADAVTAVAFAGSRIVSVSEDGTVRVVDGATGAELAVRRGHQGGGYLTVSPDGRYAVTGGRDGVALFWDLDDLVEGGAAGTQSFRAAWFHDRRVQAVRFAPDGVHFHTLSAGAWRTFAVDSGVPSDVALPRDNDPLAFDPALVTIPDDLAGGVLSSDGTRLLVLTARNVVLDYTREPGGVPGEPGA